ncbi:MAG: DUF5925 domain-containing protein [Candidatus Binataceae bacterium]
MDEKLGYPANSVHWGLDVSRYTRAGAAFAAVTAANGLKIMLEHDLPPTSERLRPDTLPGELIVWLEACHGRHSVVRWPGADAVVMVNQKERDGLVVVAANDRETARKIIAEVWKLLPPAPFENAILPITFWYLDHEYIPKTRVRDVDVAVWDELASNYAVETRTRLAALMRGFTPAKDGGQILLWHGEPGTGKTYAIRALAWAWKEWCQFEYIIDPEQLFGRGHFLTEVMLHRVPDGAGEDILDEKASEAPPKREACPERSRRKWRLLLLEDSGEMMGIDAKDRVGQGLSRLLNLSDGILGQGQKLMILVTTNEELGKLNPAIIRPGRCLSEIEFRRFGADEGNRWLRSAGCDRRIDGPRTLSELYAILGGNRETREIKIGFGPPPKPAMD